MKQAMNIFLFAMIGIMPLLCSENFTRITSDGQLVIDYKTNVANFFKNVVVKNQGGTMKSDQLEVFFEPTGNSIEKMIATGNVVIDQKEHKATSQKAVYIATDAKLILTGNPQIQKGENYYSAERIIIETKTNKVSFEPSAKIVIKQE